MPAAHERVHQVAALVKERQHVLVRHQAGIAGLTARQLAYQRGLRNLAPGDAVADGELGGVVVLVRPRMHVEIETADQLPVRQHFEGLDRPVPHRGICQPAIRDAEQRARDIEQPLLDTIERKVRTHRLRVECVIGLADKLGVVRALPAVDDGGAGGVLLLAFQDGRVFALGLGCGRGDDAVDELGRVSRAAHHLVGGDVVGPRAVANQLRQFGAPGDHPIEHLDVLWIGPVAVLHEHLLAQRLVLRVREHRKRIGIVDGQRDLSVRVRLMPRDVVAGQALEVRRIGLDAAPVLADVAVEGLADFDQLVAQRLNTFARRLVPVDAGQAEVAKQPLHVIRGLGIGGRHVKRLDGIEDVAVQRQLGRQRRRALRHFLCGLADVRVRVDRPDQLGLRAHRIELQLHIVVRAERVFDRVRPFHGGELIEQPPRVRQPRIQRTLERRRVGHAGPERDRAGADSGPRRWRRG